MGRTDVGHRATIAARLLLHGLHADVDAVTGGTVDSCKTVAEVIILSGCLSGRCRSVDTLVIHHGLVLVIGVMLLMMILDRRESVRRRSIGRQLVLTPGAEPGLALERHQFTVPVHRRRGLSGLVRDLGGLIGHFGDRWRRLVCRRSIRVRPPIGWNRRARRIHRVLLIILILILVAVRVFNAAGTGSQVLVRARRLHSDGTGARIVLRILRF